MGAKTIIILIAIWTVIQGFAYGVFSILALLAHGCRITMRQNRITYLMYIIFFRDRKCEPIEWNIVADIPPPYEPTWSAVTEVAFRTNIFAIIYITLSTLWIITSLMLIVGCFMSHKRRVIFYFHIYPWVLICTLTCIFDMIASGFFFYDLFHTLNMESFLDHLEIRNTATIFQALTISSDILPLPAVIMLGVACRGLIFWCLNLLSIPLVISMSRKIIFGVNNKEDLSEDVMFKSESPISLESHFPTMRDRSRYSDPSFYHQYQYDNMTYQKDPNELIPSSTLQQYTETLKDKSDEPKKKVKRGKNNLHRIDKEKSSKKSSGSDNSQNSISTMHLSNIERINSERDKNIILFENNRRPSWRDMTTEELKINRPHFRLPNKPSLLKKLSDSSYIEASESNTASAPYAKDVLRSEMPWSYFNGRQDPTDVAATKLAMRKSKEIFADLRDDEEHPPVPVPDYTMNARKDRKIFLNSGRQGTPSKVFKNPQRSTKSRKHISDDWDGPEYRY